MHIIYRTQPNKHSREKDLFHKHNGINYLGQRTLQKSGQSSITDGFTHKRHNSINQVTFQGEKGKYEFVQILP